MADAPKAPVASKSEELKAINTITAHDGKQRVTFNAGDVVKGLSAESMKNLKARGLIA